MSDSIIKALQTALEAQPDDIDLLEHITQLLVNAQRWNEAQGFALRLLKENPAHLTGLNLATQIFDALDLPAKAQSYRKLLTALGGESSPSIDIPSIIAERPEDDSQAPVMDPDQQTPVKLKLIDGGMSDPIWTEEETVVKLDDVAGMSHVKERLNLAFLGPLKNPELMKMYGKSLRGGLLLYGPPGCGKTYMAKAIAGELGARFISVGLSDVLDMYIGESERNLHEIFENARRNAPSVLFFDEIDALGRKRSLMREHAGRGIVNQLLNELDSVGHNNRSLFVLAASNHPWDVDTALRRPGRFDRMLLVLPPDDEARKAIFQRQFDSRPVEPLNFDKLVKATKGFSGADLVHVCNSAAELALAASMKTGKARPITMKDCTQALKGIKPSTKPWFETARNYAMFANEGGTYDELLEYLRSNRLI